ncbi:hypothetical protein [Streptomyces acidiscabies]|uniref:hypothetical protein n=1 Tax=Streptomyces acidiscabies TaxID=42234 RepID=UPI0038F744E1
MHTYDSSRWPSYAAIPSARPGQDPQSATPIYDALYTEYVKSFRALPGDRSGEEELGFTAFGGGSGHGGGYAGGYAGSHTGSYSAYSAGAQSARQQGQWQRVGTLGQQQPYQYQGTQNLPALPPGPRRGY